MSSKVSPISPFDSKALIELTSIQAMKLRDVMYLWLPSVLHRVLLTSKVKFGFLNKDMLTSLG